jgi:hypothetical protein
MRSGQRHFVRKYCLNAVPLRKTICSAESHRSIVETPKRTGSPVLGWRHCRAASFSSSPRNMPGAGGAANRCPMTEKRSCAKS